MSHSTGNSTGNFKPPALKHGAYSARVILEGESLEEFVGLHERLIAELRPQGELEARAVLTIATCVWRMDRLAARLDPDTVVAELERQARVDAFIDKPLKRLAQLKGMKRLLRIEPEPVTIEGTAQPRLPSRGVSCSGQ